MATSPLSQSSYLPMAAGVIAAAFVGFGTTALLKPQKGLEAFPFPAPTSAADKKLVENLVVVCGARDLALGVGTGAAAYFGDRKTLGWLLLAGSGVAFVDGAVCRSQGKGEWNHWSLAVLLTGLGSVLLGVLDGGA